VFLHRFLRQEVEPLGCHLEKCYEIVNPFMNWYSVLAN
jgi:hypothetical protein